MKSKKAAALLIAGIITMFIPILTFVPILELVKDIWAFAYIILTVGAICTAAGIRLISHADWFENADFYQRIGR